MNCTKLLGRLQAKSLGYLKNEKFRENASNILQIGAAACGCISTIVWGYNLIIQDEKQKDKLILEINDEIQEGKKRWEFILQSVQRIEHNQMMENFMHKIRDGSKNRSGLYILLNNRKEGCEDDIGSEKESPNQSLKRYEVINASRFASIKANILGASVEIASMGSDRRETVGLLGAHGTGIIRHKLYDFGGIGTVSTSIGTEFLKTMRSRIIDSHSSSSGASSSLSLPLTFNKIQYLSGQASGPFNHLHSGRKGIAVACPEIALLELPTPDGNLFTTTESYGSEI